MSRSLKIALAQENFTVGDLAGNSAVILSSRKKACRSTDPSFSGNIATAKDMGGDRAGDKAGDRAGNTFRDTAKDISGDITGADVIVFSELAITGYPCEDLLYRRAFVDAAEAAIRDLAAVTADGGPALLVGGPRYHQEKLFNSVFFLDNGTVQAVSDKHKLPNYGVFDEQRLFDPGPLPGPIAMRSIPVGVMICEDMWSPSVARCLAETGARVLCTVNASPFSKGQDDLRKTHAGVNCRHSELPMIYVNQCGGQDELVFDGSSFVLDRGAKLHGQMDSFVPAHNMVTIREDGAITSAPFYPLSDKNRHPSTDHRPNRPSRPDQKHPRVASRADLGADIGAYSADAPKKNPAPSAIDRKERQDLGDMYQALMLGLVDYARKNTFEKVVIGLSGGIDSALSMMLAVDAIGPENVTGLMMPSPYTSAQSTDDADALVKSLGTTLRRIPITDAMHLLRDTIPWKANAIADQNLQARLRGLILMDFSNSTGALLVSTGNKSEAAVGYMTLYGDMCGGLNILKDVYKTTVYDLSRWRQHHRPRASLAPKGAMIGQSILDRPPSAELCPDQKDTDNLPPYAVLDRILFAMLDENLSLDQITRKGFDQKLVKKIWRMVAGAEYKRRQAPPGIRVSRCLLSRERRYPIVNRAKDHY